MEAMNHKNGDSIHILSNNSACVQWQALHLKVMHISKQPLQDILLLLQHPKNDLLCSYFFFKSRVELLVFKKKYCGKNTAVLYTTRMLEIQTFECQNVESD